MVFSGFEVGEIWGMWGYWWGIKICYGYLFVLGLVLFVWVIGRYCLLLYW